MSTKFSLKLAAVIAFISTAVWAEGLPPADQAPAIGPPIFVEFNQTNGRGPYEILDEISQLEAQQDELIGILIQNEELFGQYPSEISAALRTSLERRIAAFDIIGLVNGVSIDRTQNRELSNFRVTTKDKLGPFSAAILGNNLRKVATAPAAGHMRGDVATDVSQFAVPATFRTLTETIVVEPAYERLEVVPATFKTVRETIIVEPASERVEFVPATYKEINHKIEVQKAESIWLSGESEETIMSAVDSKYPDAMIVGSRRSSSNETEFLISVPSRYSTITRRVIDKPASVRRVLSEPKTRTVERRVVDRPASVRRITVPAKTVTISRQIDNSDETQVARMIEDRPIILSARLTDDSVRCADLNAIWKWLSGPRRYLLTGKRRKCKVLETQR